MRALQQFKRGIIITVHSQIIVRDGRVEGPLKVPIMEGYQPLGELPDGSRERVLAHIRKDLGLVFEEAPVSYSNRMLVAECREAVSTQQEFEAILMALGDPNGYMYNIATKFLESTEADLLFRVRIMQLFDIVKTDTPQLRHEARDKFRNVGNLPDMLREIIERWCRADAVRAFLGEERPLLLSLSISRPPFE